MGRSGRCLAYSPAARDSASARSISSAWLGEYAIDVNNRLRQSPPYAAFHWIFEEGKRSCD